MVRERGTGAKTLDINRHGALILATVYMLLHLSRVRDPSSSRADTRCTYARCVMWYVRTYITPGVHVCPAQRDVHENL